MPPVSSDSVPIWLSKLRASATLTPFDRIVALLWSIWKTHNNAIFRNEPPQSVVTLFRATKASAINSHNPSNHQTHPRLSPTQSSWLGSLGRSRRKDSSKLILMDPNLHNTQQEVMLFAIGQDTLFKQEHLI